MRDTIFSHKSYEELEFKDDFMFGKVMEDLDLCRDVLESLLDRSVGELTELQTQKEFRFTSDGKPIRLDVFNRDSYGRVYDTEMQNLGHKSISAHELAKRSRFYQGSIDIDFMNKGNHYKTLPESIILFICTFDPYGYGLCQYTFSEKCSEMDLELNDGTSKIYYNTTYKGADIPKKLKELYSYIETGKPTGDLSTRIESAVEKGRRNEVWRTEFMKEWALLLDAKEEGREEGRAEERRNTAVEKNRADAAEARVKELEAMLEKAGIAVKE